MNSGDVYDRCRLIAAEHAARVAGGQAPAPFGADPLALVGRLDGYAEALRDLSEGVADEVKEEAPR